MPGLFSSFSAGVVEEGCPGVAVNTCGKVIPKLGKVNTEGLRYIFKEVF
ncbi:hypothetical protein ACP6EK_06410 [Candidatus Caldatribacterium sp. SIUC1]